MSCQRNEQTVTYQQTKGRGGKCCHFLIKATDYRPEFLTVLGVSKLNNATQTILIFAIDKMIFFSKLSIHCFDKKFGKMQRVKTQQIFPPIDFARFPHLTQSCLYT